MYLFFYIIFNVFQCVWHSTMHSWDKLDKCFYMYLNAVVCFTKPWLYRCQELSVLMTGKKGAFSLISCMCIIVYISVSTRLHFHHPMFLFNSGKIIDPAAGAATKWTLRQGLENDEMHSVWWAMLVKVSQNVQLQLVHNPEQRYLSP